MALCLWTRRTQLLWLLEISVVGHVLSWNVFV